ncbi:MAG: riboflavin synthase [Acidobacteria bacterium]|jgi:riboflavin synthase|nr:riboflavin synthase [Acidobacteriota bacterium]
MFTGIILKMGKFISLERKNNPTLTIDAGILPHVKLGDSVAVNGSCLTAVEITGNLYKFNLSQETLRLSNFGDLTRGSYVNIELPLTLQDFLGGHLVSGHLDGLVRVKTISPSTGSTKFSFTYQERRWQKFLIHKGSVTLNGISLTISEVKNSFFSVEIIPHTLDSTNLKYLKIGERVNIELDMLAKHIQNLIQPLF